ncbi:MAG: type I-D CRISPR-associated protein Cas10d/Csc3, partial [Methanothrix sp.]|nr:type I-D CRISPR-associated protein Cas10d/Csc3 [Methanothrix sp.]
MVADALQDIFKDRTKLKEMENRLKETSFKEPEPSLFEEYLNTVDIHLVEWGMAFKPSKSVEFGKTDQSMLNHIRNGILFLFRFNEALEKLSARPLDKNGLRECISLFVVHDLHKLKFGEWKQDEETLEILDTMENQFEIPADVLMRFIKEMHLKDFAPKLKDVDYFSVAVALHKSRFSRSGARTSHFMDLEPFLYLMDNMASCASPEEAVSARSLKALRDGFPQDSAESQLNLQYHRLDDVKGILSGIINKSVADVLQEQGLVMLMAYQDGCVYLSKGIQKAKISGEFI